MSKALEIENKLAVTPQNDPKYAINVKNSKGAEIPLADPRYTRAMIALMNQHAVNGGAAAHWGGPSAFAEVSSAVHGIMFQDKSKNWFDSYNFVNDAGHAENGIYAVRSNYGFDGLNIESIMKFRSIESKLTGHGEAHLNPEGVFISNGPLGSGLPQAQGLAIADKLSGNDRLTFCLLTDGASMEGEAKESFSALPGLAGKGKINPFVLVISDNNTKLSGRIDADSFSMTPSLNAMETLGWNVIRESEGHDLQKVYTAMEKAVEEAKKDPTVPVCVLLKTIKGYGVKSTEESASGGHGYPLKPFDGKITGFIDEIYNGELPSEFKAIAEKLIVKESKEEKKATSDVKSEKVQAGLSRAMIKAAKEGLPVFSLCSDVPGSTGTKGFQQEFPEMSLDIGIAEANMVGTAIGLSKQGYIPVVDTFAQFGITKGNLPLIMAALSQGPIIGVFSHTGLQDAADGASHQATTYISAIASIPHTELVQCATSSEAESYMYQAIKNFEKARKEGKTPNTVIILLGRENYPEYYKKEATLDWGKAQVLKDGSDVTIVASGPSVKYALQAQELLEKDGVSATVINNSFVNAPDTKTIADKIKAAQGRLVTVEDHQQMAGMGAILSHALLLEGHSFSVKSLGIQGKFGQSAYLSDHLYAAHGLDANSIVKAAKELIK